MRFTRGCWRGLLALGCAGDVVAQSSVSGPELPEVLVSGYRQSLEAAQTSKRSASQILDSIFAEDIGKLPDTNTAEALQRVPGVQINTDLGEGSTVVIRGLGQVETLLNGRETFTAAGTRTLNFEFIPAELLAGVNVYKTPSASQLEGGIGGIVDIRTRRPFDFPGATVRAAALANFGDLARKARPQLSLLVSDRWRAGNGEIGALLSVSYQERQLREDFISAGAPTCYGPVSGGVCTSGIIGPNGFFNPQFVANRRRTGLTAMVQWKPADTLELYTEAHYAKFETPQLNFGTFALPNSTLARAATGLYPGTDIIQSATYINQPLHTLSIDRLQTDTDRQAAVGAEWRAGELSIHGDVSYLDTREELHYHELDLQTILPTFSIDTSGSPPAESFTGVDLGDITNYHFAGLTDSENLWLGWEGAARLDARYALDWTPLTSIELGGRYAELGDGLTPTRYFNARASGPAAANPNLIESYPLGTAFSGAGDSTLSHYLVVNPELLRNLNAVISSLGLTQYPAVQPQGIYTIKETDSAAYLKANFAARVLLAIDGNIGLRFVHTANTLSGTETITGAPPVYVPLRLKNSYGKLLPSFNLRAVLREGLQMRFAAYASVTRPEFSNLNPGLTLVPANLTGFQGNPTLAPYTATNYDATVEWYFREAGSLHGNVFYKRVTGFPFTSGASQVIDGATYIISQPRNSGSGTIQGIETGYQQFYGFLPGALGGLGLQMNLTYVNSSAPTAVSAYTAPLPNLSRWSYNLIGLYERGRWSGRLAWFWRSQFLQSIAVAAGVGVVPVESQSFGQLAAALNWSPSAHLTLELAGTNLTRARHQTFIGSILSPSATYIDDRQYIAGARYRF